MTIARKQRGVVGALVVSNMVSVLLFGMRVIATGSVEYWFLFWNLLLAWVPLLCVWLLAKSLREKTWLHPVPVALTLAWLAFLPNSFYIISDLIHLQNTGEIGLLFDAVLFLSFIWNGAVAGMLSMLWIHKQLLKRRTAEVAAWIMAGVIAATSFAIYLGRSLRWNTWDALVNPAGIIFDVSERVINPLAHPQVFITTLTFFVLIGSMYLVVWSFVQLLPTKTKR